MDKKTHIAALEAEKAGYDAKVAGARTVEARERYTDRGKQVDAELRRVKAARANAPETATSPAPDKA